MGRLKTALFLLTIIVSASLAGEITDSYRNAHKKYLMGEYLDAAAEYEYLVTLGSLNPVPAANMALMYRDIGQPEVAAAHWLKSTLLDDKDPFLWNMRGWNYLALSRFREARDSFKKAVDRSTASVYTAESYFGLGVTDSIDGNLKASLESLRKAVAYGNPYLRAAADGEIGRVKVKMRDYSQAIPHLTSSLGHDTRQPELARFLGQVYEKTNQAKAAWQAYKFALDMHPNDPPTLERKTKMERYIPGNPTASLPLVRLARPMMRTPQENAVEDSVSPPIRVGMFSGPDGRLRHLTRFYVMGSSTTRLYDVRLREEVATAGDFTQWEILYRPDNRVIEIRDNSSRIIYVTKQPFRIEALVPGHTVLLKNPEMTDIRGMDLSDRELRASIEIIPTPFGFHVVNELPMDQYLFSVIGQILPRNEFRREKRVPLEAYKAVTLLMRTKIQEQIAMPPSNPERTHTCDSEFCLTYKGLSRERKRATKAVRETRAMTVRLPQNMKNEHHLACGWTTASGIQDRTTPSHAFRHPYDLETLLHRYPDPKQFSEQSADVPQVWNRWVRMLDAEELRHNIKGDKDVGPIRHVSVKRRDATGRVHALEVQGARGEMILTGEEAIQAFLSPGGLRSTLFTLQPIYRSKKLIRLLVWGAGTGHGRGLCIAGTLGRAHSGHSFVHILRHYFPQIGFKGVPAKLLDRPLPQKKKKAIRKKRSRPRVQIRRGAPSSTSEIRSPSKRRPPRKRRKKTQPPSQ